MDGVTDAAMRAFQGKWGAFTYAVTEFLRVSETPIPGKVFRRDVPELLTGAKTSTGLPVQVQILGGDPERMAKSAVTAVKVGATAIDINFGCPAPTVNRNDGGASLLRYPCRIRDIVQAVREAVPTEIPVSAKIRLGWDSIDPVFENAAMVQEGGASWITIHARTRVQSYKPPVFWDQVGKVREQLQIPVIANGDIWTIDEFRRCREETGCDRFMIGRSALANPVLSWQIAKEMGLPTPAQTGFDWESLFRSFLLDLHEQMARKKSTSGFRAQRRLEAQGPLGNGGVGGLFRLKQWIKFAHNHGDFPHFESLKLTQTLDDFFEVLAREEARLVQGTTETLAITG
jgi:tRNA-dihydrouridine synthase C